VLGAAALRPPAWLPPVLGAAPLRPPTPWALRRRRYAPHGNLHDHIKGQRAPLPEPLVWKLLLQVGASPAPGTATLRMRPCEPLPGTSSRLC
jgi:hypothetical protein